MPNPQSEQDRALLTRAAELHRPLARAAKIANSNGACLAVFGGLTLLVSVFGPDYVALLLGACVLGVGIAEVRAGARLRDADLQAARQLARNELVLMGAIVLYGTLKLTLLRPQNAELEAAASGARPDLDVKAMLDSMTTVVYATVIAVAVLYQGGMARYFLRKQPDVVRFQSEVPEWARKLVQRLSG